MLPEREKVPDRLTESETHTEMSVCVCVWGWVEGGSVARDEGAETSVVFFPMLDFLFFVFSI